jgi:coenzyme F420 hydrogenase subunit beta
VREKKMVHLTINRLGVDVEDGTTLLEAARTLGFPIPALCHADGLTPYGACRLCVVEIGEGPKAKLVSSCTYPAQAGLVVRTASRRVLRARRMILKLMLASCPQSKTVQDLASKAGGIHGHPFKQEYEDCLLCGLCVRMCEDFDSKSDQCRTCGGCQYICPACQLRCTYSEPEKAVCGGCENLAPPCVDVDKFDDMSCYLDPCVACEIQKE